MKPDLLFLLVISLTLTALPAAPRPNIILAMADDMGWGDPGYNSTTVTFADGTPHPDQGWISTPTMDAMAANGLRFDRFYSASAVCSPTRASCLTGRNPFRVGVPTANAGRLGFDETPLSEVLSGQGYLCGHFGKWHLGSLTTLRADSNRGGNAGVYSGPWHHSYDFCFCTESKVPTYHPYRRATNGLALPTSFDKTDDTWYGTYYWRMPATWNQTSGEGDIVPLSEVNNAVDGDDSKLLVDQAIPFIQSAVAADERFFVVLWFHTPHKPVVDPEGVSGVDSSDAGRDSIQDLDTALGRIRTELTNLGVRGNTMFWVTSDNGPENGVNSFNESDTVRSIRSGRFLERKRSLHEGGVRVPGILEWPDVITSGMSTGFPAVTSDYYPTILDYLCLAVPNQKPLDGISLRPVIEGTATTRTKPIGFKFSGDKSWVTQQYKLIDDGSGWELYDLINIPAGEEVEQTPTATAANIATQPQAIRDVYTTMVEEITAWEAAVNADEPYVHPSQPTVMLDTPSNDVTEPFIVTATFSEDVAELNAGEFSVTNGAASDLTGSGTTWTLTVSPTFTGAVTVNLPEGCAIDPDGNPNAASNSLAVNYTDPEGGAVTIISSMIATPAGRTVDSLGNVPGNQSNNVAKFTAGNINDGVANPYTTTLYARSSSSDNLRKVRAFVRFDLSGLGDHPVAGANLSFNGHSLNDQTAMDIEVVPLGADWSDTGSPLPTFGHPTVGTAVSGGSVIAGLAPGDHTKDYDFDVTGAVRNWLDGTWPNHGLQIRLTSTTANNGVGIRTSGEGAIQLHVDQAPLITTGLKTGAPGPGDLTIRWNSAPDVVYRIESSILLQGDWAPIDDVSGDAGPATIFVHEDGLTGPPSRFYRVRHLPGPPPGP